MVRSLNQEIIHQLLPDRTPYAHKGDFGKVLLLCGSRGFTGAAYLASMGALRCGAGLVFLGVPESIYAIEAVKLNEAVVFPLEDCQGMISAEAIPEILERIGRMDAVLIGCGLSQSDSVESVVLAVLEHAKCPVIVDADGINMLCRNIDVLRDRVYPSILTPHDGEFQRLTTAMGYSGKKLSEYDADDFSGRAAVAMEVAKALGCVLLLKGHHTCITDGQTCYRNATGNPGMAVGGSGDVLAGMITALVGQGLDTLEAAACGAWLHGAAGDCCAEAMGQYAMLPTDMLDMLPRLLK